MTTTQTESTTSATWTFEGYWNTVMGDRSAEQVVAEFDLAGPGPLSEFSEWLGAAEAEAWRVGGLDGDMADAWGAFHDRAARELQAAANACPHCAERPGAEAAHHAADGPPEQVARELFALRNWCTAAQADTACCDACRERADNMLEHDLNKRTLEEGHAILRANGAPSWIEAYEAGDEESLGCTTAEWEERMRTEDADELAAWARSVANDEPDHVGR
jgi:hypothetical protein